MQHHQGNPICHNIINECFVIRTIVLSIWSRVPASQTKGLHVSFFSFHCYECHWTGKYMKDYNMYVSFEEFQKNKQANNKSARN
jgi:hypothetical protein